MTLTSLVNYVRRQRQSFEIFFDNNLFIFRFVWSFIEFSALMLNVESGYVEAAFHEYVRPTRFKKLDDCFDVESTGLTRAFIERQKSFDIIYDGFDQWLNQIIVKYHLMFATPRCIDSANGVNVTFCTWTDWDMGHHFYMECIRNGIERRDSMKSWIDVRRAFEVSSLFWCRFCVNGTFLYVSRNILFVFFHFFSAHASPNS